MCTLSSLKISSENGFPPLPVTTKSTRENSSFTCFARLVLSQVMLSKTITLFLHNWRIFCNRKLCRKAFSGINEQCLTKHKGRLGPKQVEAVKVTNNNHCHAVVNGQMHTYLTFMTPLIHDLDQMRTPEQHTGTPIFRYINECMPYFYNHKLKQNLFQNVKIVQMIGRKMDREFLKSMKIRSGMHNMPQALKRKYTNYKPL